MIDVIIVKKSVRRTMPPDRSTRPVASLRPMPVRVTVPAIMPAPAQATATPTAPLAPCSNTPNSPFRLTWGSPVSAWLRKNMPTAYTIVACVPAPIASM